MAAGQKRRGGGGIGGKLAFGSLPLLRDDLGYRIAVFRIADRRLERLRERDCPVRGQERRPAVDDARHGDRVDAGVRDARQLARGKGVQRCRVAGAAARVEAVQLFRFGVVNDREQITTDAVHRRFDNREDCRGGNRRVDRVAALLQHLQAGGRRERLARRDHPVATHHDRTRRMRVGGRPIARQGKLWRFDWRLRTAGGDEHEQTADDDDRAFHRILPKRQKGKRQKEKVAQDFSPASVLRQKLSREALEHARQYFAVQRERIEFRRPREFIAP